MPLDPWATNPTEHRGGGEIFHVNVGEVYSLLPETKPKTLFQTQTVLMYTQSLQQENNKGLKIIEEKALPQPWPSAKWSDFLVF